MAELLSRAPMVAIGRRSYGLYLYHWPVFVLLRELPLPAWKINFLGVLVTVAVVEASYRWIETPVRRGGLGALMGRLRLPRPAVVIAFGAATSALLATVVALTTTAIDDPSQLYRLVADARIGSTATIRVLREGRSMDFKIPIVSVSSARPRR